MCNPPKSQSWQKTRKHQTSHIFWDTLYSGALETIEIERVLSYFANIVQTE